MKVIVAEDDPLTAQLFEVSLEAMGHEVSLCVDGKEAWDLFQVSPVSIVLSDWDMPEMTGIDLTKKIRDRKAGFYTYIILITAKTGKVNYQTAMDAGVDDFLTKPVELAELHMRLRVAERIISFRAEFAEMKQLMPICSYCKSVRRDDDYWERIERYIEVNFEKDVSHGICPSCYEKEVIPQFEELEKRKNRPKE